MKEEPDLIVSNKSQPVYRDERVVFIEIFRLDNKKRWSMAIDDEFGNTTVFDKDFKSEKGALLEAQKCIDTDGIQTFIGPEDGKSEWPQNRS